jgi:hypothetical protein
MKKATSKWKSFLKENKEIDDILDKVRDIFFGAYDSWTEEYKSLHSDKNFQEYMIQIKNNSENKFFHDPKKMNKVISGASIGISLYWSDNEKHGVGDEKMCGYLITKKLSLLQDKCSDVELSILKNGLFQTVVTTVSGDRSNPLYPVELAVSSGFINGQPVDDAYMTTREGLQRYVVPILKGAGYSIILEPPKPEPEKRKERNTPLSPEEMLKMMRQFGERD